MKYIRGISVLLFLLIWPVLWFISSIYIFGFDGQCIPDNCDTERSVKGIFETAYIFFPPLVVISLWLYWRMKVRGLGKPVLNDE